MTRPKFKEGGHARSERLDLGKPHIMWCRHLGTWLVSCPTLHHPGQLEAWDFCDEQNARRTLGSIK